MSGHSRNAWQTARRCRLAKFDIKPAKGGGAPLDEHGTEIGRNEWQWPRRLRTNCAMDR